MIFIAVTFIYSVIAHENAFSKNNSADEFVIGKIDYIGKSGRDGIVVLSSPEKAYLLDKGVLLLIKRGSEQIVLKINDVDGKYIRCAVNSETGAAVIRHGEDVFYSDSINSSIKYRDAKSILAGLIKLYEDFILKIESTEDPRAISDAVKNFSIELDKLIPEIKRINSKYPELGKFDVSPPAELQNESSRLGLLEPRLRDAFFKIKMFSSDENVKKATVDLQKVLTKMKPGK